MLELCWVRSSAHENFENLGLWIQDLLSKLGSPHEPLDSRVEVGGPTPIDSARAHPYQRLMYVSSSESANMGQLSYY